jgi:hypothetical protein
MQIKELLSHHSLHLSPSVYAACQTGIELMSQSQDPLHNQNHIFRMLDILDEFISGDRHLNWHRVDFEVLILSICWHDCWKSLRRPASKRAGVYHMVAEGWGSYRMFGQRTKKFHLDPLLVKQTKYAIRKHSVVQFLPRRTMESRILQDVDHLEEWSAVRLREGVGDSKTIAELSPKLVKLYQFYFNHWMARKHHAKFNYQWPQSIYKKRQQEFVKEAGLIMKSLVQYWFNRRPETQPTASSLLSDKN